MSTDPYFALDGTGDYLSTADVNLLDGDTGNIVQGYGAWQIPNSQVADASAFGGNAARYVVGSGTAFLAMNGTPWQSASVGVDYVGGVYLNVTADCTAVAVSLDFRDASDANLAFSGFVDDTPTVGWAYYDTGSPYTAPASTDHVRVSARVKHTAGDEVLIGQAWLRSDDTQGFVPSLNTTGTNETLTCDPAGATASLASGVLKVGDGYTGKIYLYERTDGAGGPVVCRLDPLDV